MGKKPGKTWMMLFFHAQRHDTLECRATETKIVTFVDALLLARKLKIRSFE